MNLLFAFATTLASFAGNDGPSPIPRPVDPSVILEKATYCGFFCPKGDEYGVRLLSDGEVFAFTVKRGSPEVRTAKPSLPLDQLSAIRVEVDALRAAELVSDAPGAPPCMDAPETQYNAFQSNGSKLEFARWAGCHNYSLPDASGAGLKSLLDKL
jgi:hypothetical protein